MPVSTDDLRAAVTSLYPDNVGGEIDATEQQGRRAVHLYRLPLGWRRAVADLIGNPDSSPTQHFTL